MRRIIATEYLTLDGVMEDPGGGEATRYGGWSPGFFSEEASKFKFDELFASDALLLGRITYQGFAQAWPTMKDEQGFADRMNGLPKFVVSSTLQKAGWNNSTVIRSNIWKEVAKLKQQAGQDILIAGSGQLVRGLMAEDLIDEYRLMVHPITVGGGKRLFPEAGTRTVLRLTGTQVFQAGIVVLSYEPVRTPKPA
jgi:dihydrofolate reductase